MKIPILTWIDTDNVVPLWAHAEDLTDMLKCLLAYQEALQRQMSLEHGAARADEERLIAAAKRAGITYWGCDTPDMLAEEIVSLRAAVEATKEKSNGSDLQV